MIPGTYIRDTLGYCDGTQEWFERWVDLITRAPKFDDEDPVAYAQAHGLNVPPIGGSTAAFHLGGACTSKACRRYGAVSNDAIGLVLRSPSPTDARCWCATNIVRPAQKSLLPPMPATTQKLKRLTSSCATDLVKEGHEHDEG